MIKRTAVILVIILLISTNVYADGYRNIEIFSINQGKIIKELQSTSQVQNLAINYIEGIEGIYSKFDPIPKSGYAIKIPLEPSVKIQELNTFVDQIIIMFPEKEAPFLIIFENETRMVCFAFKGNTNLLLKSLEFEPNSCL